METIQKYAAPDSWAKRLTATDGLFMLALVVGVGLGFARFNSYMDIYEKVILLAAVATYGWMGLQWKPLRLLGLGLAVLVAWSIHLYAGSLGAAEQRFMLKYALSSQSAILWMIVFFVLSALFYWGGLLSRSDFGYSVGSALCWSGVVIGFVGMLVRWYESYLMGPDIGHIPVSNLYEVFILFCLITALFYLYYETIYKTRQLGPFVLLVVVTAIGFVIWYTFAREAAQIQPLVPALQSWWMKIHVPANFIGYGTFSLASMVAWAYLLKHERPRTLWTGLVFVPLGMLVFAWVLVLITGSNPLVVGPMLTVTKLVSVLLAVFAAVNALRTRISERLPSSEVLEDVMYKAITVGFAFFTIATILGALWAAEAWGGYWSWDPKETWALILWLNYAAWLHFRLIKGLRGPIVAWWALAGLPLTTFAFLGVNMFLSGLHSYGTL